MSTVEENRSASQGSAPLLRVVSGEPTPVELAAVIAVLAARTASSGDDGADGDRPYSGWTDRSRGVHAPLHQGPGGWRASGRLLWKA